MQEFFYDVLQPAFGQDNLHLLFTDTDSFGLQIYTKDLYGTVKNYRSKISQLARKWMDMNDCKVPGLFKYKIGSNDKMFEWVGLR